MSTLFSILYLIEGVPDQAEPQNTTTFVQSFDRHAASYSPKHSTLTIQILNRSLDIVSRGEPVRGGINSPIPVVLHSNVFWCTGTSSSTPNRNTNNLVYHEYAVDGKKKLNASGIRFFGGGARA